MNLVQSLRHAMHYGSISGLCSFGVFIILYYLVINPLGNISYVGFWIPIVFIVLAIKSYKLNATEGIMSFGQGLRTGIYTGFFSALLFSLLLYLFINIFDPSIVENHKEYLLSQLEVSKEMWNSSIYHMSLENIKNTTLGSLAWSEFNMKFLGGVIVSLIAAAFYKSPKPTQN